MFSKLMKQEFKAMRRIVPFVYLVTVIMILTSLLTRQLDIAWLSTFLLVMLVLFGLAEILVTYVLVFYRYYKNLYNSEGYLMHTLPVRPSQLLTSKIVSSFIWLLISYTIMVGVVLTIALLVSGDQGLGIGQILDQVLISTGLTKSAVIGLIIAMVLYLCLSILLLMAQVFFAISLGNHARFHSLGLAAPILFYIGIYFVTEIGILAGMILVPLGITVENQTLRLVGQSMLTTLLNPDKFVFGLGSILFIILAVIGLFLGTSRLLNRHTSLR